MRIRTRKPELPLCFVQLALVLSATLPCLAQSKADFEAAREKLIQNAIIGSGIKDERVLNALRQTDRHEFVPAAQRRMAYEDMSLPIGGNQTISSPFIVAYMTESLDPQPTDRVLEIGTGSGFQAAILSPIVKDVYSIEIVEVLGRKARQTFRRLKKYDNVHLKIGDGYKGWPEHAPFDKIIVTCSPESVPKPLVEQLKEGGLMVVPVGERYQQTLVLFKKVDGKLKRKELRPTLFVPMTGEAEERREVLPNRNRVVLRNASFEEKVNEKGHFPGWFYLRQATQVKSSDAPDGDHFVKFSNSTPRLGSRVLQGFAVDGQQFKKLEVTANIKYENVQSGPSDDMRPAIAITFYDKSRDLLGGQWIGPWDGSSGWKDVKKTFSIPTKTREAIFRIGLFGATGEFYVDNIRIDPVKR